MDTVVSEVPKAKAWPALVKVLAAGLLLYEAMSGLAIYLMPMGDEARSEVLSHAVLGISLSLFLLIFQFRHWRTHRDRSTLLVRALGYTGVLATLGIALSGLVLTNAVLIRETSEPAWDLGPMASGVLFMLAVPAHLIIGAYRRRNLAEKRG